MLQFFVDNPAWIWFSLGLLLLAIEALAPGAFFLWFGFGAIATSFVSWIFDPGWEIEVTFWALSSVISLAIYWKFFRRDPKEKDEADDLNHAGHYLVGRELTVEADFKNGRGRVKASDTSWRAQCADDVKAGTAVRVLEVDSGTLVVEAIGNL